MARASVGASRRRQGRRQAPAEPRRAPTAIVAGLLHEGLGLGEAARGYAMALDAAGFEVSQLRIALPGRPASQSEVDSRESLPFPHVGADTEADLVVVCLNPPEIDFIHQAGLTLPAGRVNVGVWAWEVEPVPASWSVMASSWRFDELWAISGFVAALLEPAFGIPVEVVSPPVWSTSTAPGRNDDDLVRRDTFLVILDGASTFARKNPMGAVRAFMQAFEPGDGPRIVVKLWNGVADPDALREIRDVAAERPDIEIIDRWLPRDELAELMGSAAAVVSLHRSEGLGLVLFEALAAGVPVVATRGSGSSDLLDDNSAFLVDAVALPVPPGTPAYPEGSLWAEPDLADAARQLRAVWADPEAAERRAERGRRVVAERLTPAAVGDRIRARRRAWGVRLQESSPRSVFRPPVQVVIHAADPWPSLSGFLDAALPEIRAVGAELLIGAADDDTLPEGKRPAGVRRVVVGRRSPFALRRAALDLVDADLVLVTEDHCRPAPSWITRYKEAMATTDADAFIGVVANGATRTRADWANYLMGFASFAAPLSAVPRDRAPTVANCAVTGAALRSRRSVAASDRDGWFERDFLVDLWREGRVVVAPGAVVDHVQRFPGWRHAVNHLADARQSGSFDRLAPMFRAPAADPGALLDVARGFLRGTSDAVGPRSQFHEPHRQAAGWLRLLAISRAVGLAWGARWGDGRSTDWLD